MAVKTLTIREKVYNRLKKDKKLDESFSEYFDRLLDSKKPDYMKFAGSWGEKKAKEIKKIIKKARKEDELLSIKREKRLGLA